MRIYSSILILFCIISISNGQSFKDCDSAFPVCQLKTYHFNEMGGIGKKDAIGQLNCSVSFKETNSIWLSFSILKSGIVTFVISPKIDEQDLDFVLFKRVNSDCNNFETIRCMASGENVGNQNRSDENCKGLTGLSVSSLDEFEEAGCKFSDDNYLKFLQANEDEEYLLLVNNFDNRDGFSISFDGNALFKEETGCIENWMTNPLKIVELYPNPATNSINLEYSSINNENVSANILTLNGEIIENVNLNTKIGTNKKNIDITNLSAGTFLLRLTQNGLSSVKQFVKI